MSSGSAPASFVRRLVLAWRALAPEQRRVVLASALVLASMFLPWYSKSVNAVTRKGLSSQSEAKLAIFVPSFVEASIFLVAVALLVLMWARGNGRAFHLPFGDGTVVTAAGAWVGFLIFYRFIDQPSGGISNAIQYEYNLSWGIFFALLAAAGLVYAGTRLRLAHVAEPPLSSPRPRRPRPAAETEVAPSDLATTPAVREQPARDRRDPTTTDGGTQMTFDEPD
jgi:hypothetical protein